MFAVICKVNANTRETDESRVEHSYLEVTDWSPIPSTSSISQLAHYSEDESTQSRSDAQSGYEDINTAGNPHGNTAEKSYENFKQSDGYTEPVQYGKCNRSMSYQNVKIDDERSEPIMSEIESTDGTNRVKESQMSNDKAKRSFTI